MGRTKAKNKAPGTVTGRLPAVTSPIAVVRAIRSPKQARSALGYVQSELATELGRLSGQRISTEMIKQWDTSRRAIPEAVRIAYGTLLANWLSRSLGREIGVTLAIHSPWHVQAYTRCARCGHWFEMRTPRAKFCGCQKRQHEGDDTRR